MSKTHFWLGLVALAALAACDARAPGRQALIDRCLAGGQPEGYCVCLARETNRRLDDEMFSLVVMAAAGQPEEAEDILSAFEPEEQLTYATLVGEVARVCAAPPAG